MRNTRDKQTFFRGRERSRLLAMIALLVVLYLAIERSRRSESWLWLTGDDQTTGEAATNGSDEESAESDNRNAPNADAAGAAKASDGNGERQPKLAFDDEFPPDEDEEEQGALAENLETVVGSDGKLGLHKLEMPAYWRLVDWATRQTPEAMAKRKVERVTFDQFMREPNQHRGKLTKFVLNVRRVIEQPAEQGNPVGVEHVFELIGFSEESGSRLSFCIVPELPKGMPVGLAVDERVTFVGYFLKIQGFEHDQMLVKKSPKDAGPLFIGRIVRQAPAAAPSEDPAWAWWLLGGVGVTMVVAVAGWILKPHWQRTPRRPSVEDADKKRELDEFASPRLEETSSEDVADERFDDDPGDAWKKPSCES